MAKHYSEVFKMDVVSSLRLLKEKGIIRLEKEEIKNVRQLCEFYDISSYSLYDWVKLFPIKKSEIKDVSDDSVMEDAPELFESYEDYQKTIENRVIESAFKAKTEKAYEDGDAHESESEFDKHVREMNEGDDFDGLSASEIRDELSLIETNDDFDDINYEKDVRIAEKSHRYFYEKKTPEIAYKKKTKSNISGKFNFSIELNLIKSLYANRFGSSTNKTKVHMLRALTNAWSEK